MCSVEVGAGGQSSAAAADPSPAPAPAPPPPPPPPSALTVDVAASHDTDDTQQVSNATDAATMPPPITGACCRGGHGSRDDGGHTAHALHRWRSASPASPGPFRRTSLPDPRARSRTQEMVADHQSIEHLFENNRRWRDHKKSVEPAFFERTGEKQTPRYLWIGCSDSRVPAEEITGLAPGEMFVHRNIANMVVSNDISALSVIQYAVEKLRVKDIIVCGHYGCGGVLAAMENKTLGLLDNWLRSIRDVCRLYQPDLVAITTENERFRRIVELNIIEQCLNIFKINMVQRHQIKYGFPRIHGLVYDIHTGELKELDIDFHGYLRKFSGIYRLHSFPTDDLPKSRAQLRVNIVRYLVEGHEEDEGRVSARYITRALKAEKELFDVDEVDDAIAYAKEMVGDELSPFINTEDIIQFFTEDEASEIDPGGEALDATLHAAK